MDLRDRERAEEFHWVLLQEESFLRRMQRDRAFGLWLARRLGMRGTEAADLAGHLVAADVEHGERHMLDRAWEIEAVRNALSAEDLHAALDWFDIQSGIGQAANQGVARASRTRLRMTMRADLH